MHYRLLGQTGLYVSELCLGTMTFGGSGRWEVMGGLKQDAVNQLVKRSFEAGVNFFDTANVYSFGAAEETLGTAIKALGLPRDELVIATKATGVMSESAINGRGQSRIHLFNELEASLKRLQLDHIDLYQIHGFDPLTPLEETLESLNDMVRSGKVRYIGLCNLAAWQVMKALSISKSLGLARFQSVQAYYTIAGRDLERELVPLMEDQKLGLMVWSPLAGGLLSGRTKRDSAAPEGTRRASFDFPIVNKERAFNCVDAMEPIAQAHGVSVAQIALAWLLSRPVVSSVIIGAKTIEQLDDNLAASNVKLSSEQLKILDDVSQLPPEYPGWMLALQGGYRAKAPARD
jgi:aryl-alcohol dehydrogenase-like predicted oxidoreductase